MQLVKEPVKTKKVARELKRNAKCEKAATLHLLKAGSKLGSQEQQQQQGRIILALRDG